MASASPLIDLGIIIGGVPSQAIGPTVTVDATEVNEYLTKLVGVVSNPTPFVRIAAQTYRNHLVENYLTGQRLKVRTGRMRGSWVAQPRDRQTYWVTAGRLPYSRIHEYGYNKAYQFVRGYTTSSGRKVSHYWRHMKLRERRFIRDALETSSQIIFKAIQDRFSRRVS